MKLTKYVFLLILLLVIAGCSSETSGEQIQSLGKSQIDPYNLCSSIIESEKQLKSDCFLEIAEGENNWDVCDQIPNPATKDTCLTSKAVSQSNVAVCTDVSLNGQDSCEWKVYESIALSDQNIDSCKEITSPLYFKQCVKNFVEKYPDIDHCQVFNDVKDKDSCIASLSVSLSDISICGSISDSNINQKRTCHMNIVNNSVSVTKSMCDLGDGNIDDFCLVIAASKSGDESICSDIKTEFTRETCFSRLALVNADVSFCNEVSTKLTKDVCIYLAAAEAEDSSQCKKLDDSQTICYVDIVRKTGNINLCAKIKDDQVNRENIVQSCIADAAMTILNTEICDLVPNGSKQESECYLHLVENYYK